MSTGMDWGYYTLSASGRLIDDAGDLVLGEEVVFSSADEAEVYLIEHDIRGSVR